MYHFCHGASVLSQLFSLSVAEGWQKTFALQKKNLVVFVQINMHLCITHRMGSQCQTSWQIFRELGTETEILKPCMLFLDIKLVQNASSFYYHYFLMILAQTYIYCIFSSHCFTLSPFKGFLYQIISCFALLAVTWHTREHFLNPLDLSYALSICYIQARLFNQLQALPQGWLLSTVMFNRTLESGAKRNNIVHQEKPSLPFISFFLCQKYHLVLKNCHCRNISLISSAPTIVYSSW